ncbi:hypothetical protein GCM10010403_43150 [Glycomyces rutgersensis]|uniref:Uncharacterized protein n=1 Tax=Glycomyces rutgersensis TaxID=58115 RepID=A0ABP5T3V3_9ACTN
MALLQVWHADASRDVTARTARPQGVPRRAVAAVSGFTREVRKGAKQLRRIAGIAAHKGAR